MRLNQVIASIQELKRSSDRGLTSLKNQFLKTADFAGIQKHYRPKEEDGDELASEGREPLANAREMVRSLPDVMSKFLDTAATQDVANTKAKADVIVSATVLLSDVPVSQLLFLESQLKDIKTLIEFAPTLPLGYSWSYDFEGMVYKTDPTETVRTKKTEEFKVVVPPTDNHPAHVEKVTKDEIVGHWVRTDYNTSLSATTKKQLIQRVDNLLEAVIHARHEANSMKVEEITYSQSIFNYLFGGIEL